MPIQSHADYYCLSPGAPTAAFLFSGACMQVVPQDSPSDLLDQLKAMDDLNYCELDELIGPDKDSLWQATPAGLPVKLEQEWPLA